MKDMTVKFLFAGILGLIVCFSVACRFGKEQKEEKIEEKTSGGASGKETKSEANSSDIDIPDKKKKDPAYLGKWLDLNGDFELEIRKKELIFRFDDKEVSYRYHETKKDGFLFLVSEREYGDFEFMSEMEVQKDGSLHARELVVDKNPHFFHFVREEAYKRGKKIRDYSKEAPKTIQSTEIIDFDLSFYHDGVSDPLPKNWEIGRYRWQIEKDADGSYLMNFNISGDSYRILRYSEKVDASFVEGLEKLIREQGLHELNGYYKKNEVKRSGYYLYVSYESGEMLSIAADGDAAATCVFDLGALLDYTSVLKMKRIGEE